MTDGQETTTAAIATSKSKNFKFLLTIAGLVLVIGLLAYFLRPQKTETSAAPQAVPTGSPRPQSVGPEPTKQKEEIPVLVEQKTHENDEARRQQEAARVVEVKRQQALEAEAKRLKQEEEAAAILEKQRRDALLKGVEMILAERNRNISNYNFACEAVLKTNELRMPRVTFLNKKAVRGFQERNREASRRVAEFVAREEQIMKEFKGLLTLPNTNTISELQAAQNTLIQRLNEHDTTERPTLSAMIKKLANDIDERFADKGAPLIGIGIR